MNRYKGIICFYLTVAVLMTIALVPFSDKNISLIENNENKLVEDVCGTVLSQDIVNDSSETYAESQTLAHENESTTELMYSENTTVSDAAEKQECETNEEVTEEKTEEKTVEAETKPEVLTEGADDKAEETLSPSLFNLSGYAPGSAYENIYDLYFLTSNVGSLSSSEAVNVYTFTLVNRGVFRYSVRHKEMYNLSGWTVTLYGEYYINGVGGEVGYRLLNTLTTSAGATLDRSVEIGLPAGEYRLVVTKGKTYTSENYEIDALIKDTSQYEVECNDNIFRYTEIFSAIPLKGSASAFPDRQDEDYYLFRMYEDGYAELKFEHPSVKDKTSVCWQVILYSEDGKVLYSVNSLFSDTVNKSGIIGLKAGNYYVLIKNRVYLDVNYTLTLSRTDEIGYENEKNDTKATANAIALNSTVTGSVASQINSIDRDYFKFTVEKTGYIALEFAHSPIEDSDDKKGWNYVLTDSKGNIIYYGTSAWGDDVVTSPSIGLGGGTYYICVDSENLYHNSESYYLTVNYIESDDWESECNNSFEKADAILMGTPVFGFLADCGTDFDFDYYTFTLDESADITVTFSHEVLQYSKDIFVFSLYDENKNAVNDSNGVSSVKVMSDTEKVTVKYNGLAPGKYYIKVATGLYFDQINYSLCLDKGE